MDDSDMGSGDDCEFEMMGADEEVLGSEEERTKPLMLTISPWAAASDRDIFFKR